MPERFTVWRASWKRHHPDWEHVLWSDSDLGWLANRGLYDHAGDLVPADAVEQFQADLARYEILHRWGGLYVDCDTEALRPIGDALAGHAEFAVAEDTRWVGNTYLAATPGHPIMAALVAGIAGNVARHRGDRPNRLTGPKYLTPIWRGHGAHVAPTDLFFPYSYRHVRDGTIPTDYGDAYAVHHWDHTRRVLARR